MQFHCKEPDCSKTTFSRWRHHKHKASGRKAREDEVEACTGAACGHCTDKKGKFTETFGRMGTGMGG